MRKIDLYEAVKTAAGIETKVQAERAVEAVFSAIISSLSAGEEVKISGFGVWKVKDHKERAGVNPKTGEKITIAATKKVSFKAGKELKQSVK